MKGCFFNTAAGVGALAAPVTAFFTGHAPPFFRVLSVFLTPTLALIGVVLVSLIPDTARRAQRVLAGVGLVTASIALLTVYFGDLNRWTVVNPAHSTVRYQIGFEKNPESLTPTKGREYLAQFPHETPAQWLHHVGFSEDGAAMLWTEETRRRTGMIMLVLYIGAVVTWAAGNRLLGA